MKAVINSVKSDSLEGAEQRYRMSGEVDEILNHTVGPQNYHRDDGLKQKIITHYRLNLMRMVRIAHSADAGIIFVKPAINIKDMSPFKSEHRDGLDEQAQKEWQALYQRALDLFEAGNTGEALTVYREALAIDDRYADLHYRIGKALFRLGRYDEAEEAFRQAVEEDIAPLRILAPMQQIVAEIAASENVPLVDFPHIIRQAYTDHYDHTVFGKEYFPDHVHTSMEGYRLLGLALFDQLVDQGIATPDPAWSDATVEAVRQAVIARLDPWRSEGYTMKNLGKVFDWAGKFEEAYAAFMRAMEILGPNPDIYDGLARSSYGLGRPEEAIRYLHELEATAPDFPGVHKRLAVLYTKQGKTDEAITHCRAELELNSEDYSVHARLAKLLEYQGDKAAAIRHYQTALQLKPDYEYAHVELANFLVRQQRYDEALTHAQEALRINPEQYRAYNTLGVVMKHQGKPEQAIHHFTEALRLEPGYTVARENLRQVQAIYRKNGVDDDLS
jgi:tetratricopeptide (TPR) repeat protein